MPLLTSNPETGSPHLGAAPGPWPACGACPSRIADRLLRDARGPESGDKCSHTCFIPRGVVPVAGTINRNHYPLPLLVSVTHQQAREGARAACSCTVVRARTPTRRHGATTAPRRHARSGIGWARYSLYAYGDGVPLRIGLRLIILLECTVHTHAARHRAWGLDCSCL